jgi:hypothetical protein
MQTNRHKLVANFLTVLETYYWSGSIKVGAGKKKVMDSNANDESSQAEPRVPKREGSLVKKRIIT